jgi:hypothetical protein
MYKATLEANPTNTYINTTNIIFDQQMKDILRRPSQYLSLPEEFDGRKVWEKYLVPADNQYSCGSCWAFSTASCLSDRFNILSRGKIHVDLSGLSILLCDVRAELDYNPETNADISYILDIETTEKFGCHGGDLVYAWKYVNKLGALSKECMEYSGAAFSWFKPISQYQNDDDLPLCSDVTSIYADMCTSNAYDAFTGNIIGTPALFYRCTNYYHLEGEEDIMQEIYKNGPVNTGMVVYADFYNFDPKTEIYKSQPGQNAVAGHAIEIVGWGKSAAGVKYWMIKNSWGPKWGDGGYFKMVRGENDCEIEKNMVAGIPNFWTMPGTNRILQNGYSERMYNLWKNRPGFLEPPRLDLPADFIAGAPEIAGPAATALPNKRRALRNFIIFAVPLITIIIFIYFLIIRNRNRC